MTLLDDYSIVHSYITLALLSQYASCYKGLGYWDIDHLKLGYWDIGPLKLGYLGYQGPPNRALMG